LLFRSQIQSFGSVLVEIREKAHKIVLGSKNFTHVEFSSISELELTKNGSEIARIEFIPDDFINVNHIIQKDLLTIVRDTGAIIFFIIFFFGSFFKYWSRIDFSLQMIHQLYNPLKISDIFSKLRWIIFGHRCSRPET
jgi:hypothetical protein